MKQFTKMITAAIVYSLILAAPASAQKTPKLSDPEIASVAVVANQIDINASKIAKEKSKNAEVLKFAQLMSDDHSAVLAQAVELAKKLNVTPKDNAVSRKLMADAEKTKNHYAQNLQKLLIKHTLIMKLHTIKQ